MLQLLGGQVLGVKMRILEVNGPRSTIFNNPQPQLTISKSPQNDLRSIRGRVIDTNDLECLIKSGLQAIPKVPNLIEYRYDDGDFDAHFVR